MTRIWWGLLLALTLLAMAGCDAVRYPGDGRENDYEAETPPGAPGPAPPSEPVDDPYGNGDPEEDVTADPDTGGEPPTGPGPAEDEADTETDPGTIPDPDTDADPEPSTPETDPDDPASPGLDSGETDTPDGDAGTETPPEGGTDTDGSDTETGTDTDTGTDPDDQQAGTDPQPEEPEPEPTVVFSYTEPGQLVSGSGTGTTETETVFSPDMRFPIKSAPSYLQSQVWGFGGGVMGGDQCDPRNYEYPWHDNFCETRSSNRNSPYCPVSRIHQGQDIRVGTAAGCNELRRTNAADRALYEVVAVEDGIIQSIGTYTVTQRSGPRIYKYMHLNMRALQVSNGDTVKKGQTLGYVSNDFGGTPTTFHLHFEMLQNTADSGWVHVPPYTSLVAAYERRESGIGEEIIPNVAVASAGVPDIPEGVEITEGFVVEDGSHAQPEE